MELRRVTFGPADFSAASLCRFWIERCAFSGSTFGGTDLGNVSEHGSEFRDCRFVKSSFRNAHLGYRGSRFVNTIFEGVDFTRAGFLRPEFDDCVFSRCKLDGCDFNGSSFARCRFTGRLRDVWFRGGFSHQDQVSSYGQPRPNRMVDVSFEHAILQESTFSDHCDLSTVRIPADGRHALIGRWAERLKDLQEKARLWPEAATRAGDTFAGVHLAPARSQDWFLLTWAYLRLTLLSVALRLASA